MKNTEKKVVEVSFDDVLRYLHNCNELNVLEKFGTIISGKRILIVNGIITDTGDTW